MTTLDTPVARSKSGQKVRHLSRGYVVLVDDRRGEVSQRVWGETFLMIERTNRVDILFLPDEGGKVELEAQSDAIGWEIRDDDGEFILSNRLFTLRRSKVWFDFGDELNQLVA